jgi:hypothetical protein
LLKIAEMLALPTQQVIEEQADHQHQQQTKEKNGSKEAWRAARVPTREVEQTGQQITLL